MEISVTLKNLNENIEDIVIVKDYEDKNCFTYVDNDGYNCEMCIYNDGICFFRECDDHLLELHLKKDAYAKITSVEGILKLDIKNVDFYRNGDILVVHYQVDEQDRQIEIKYY